MKLNCPACGAEIQFKSSISVFGVCSFCNSMVVRHDLNLEDLGKVAKLPPDLSPIQLGARGKFESKNFEIVGRQKINWSDGSWNEWYALFDSGEAGWVADAQGNYMVSFQIQNPTGLPEKKEISLGLQIDLGKLGTFQVEDFKDTLCVGSEGELPLKGVKGRKSLSVDLTGSNQRFACLDYSEDPVRLYVGKYLTFDQLEWSGLRQLDGW